MFPLIIKCPNCNTMFKLTHKPLKTFNCPKCKFTAPFGKILDQNSSSMVQELDTMQDISLSQKPVSGEATRVVNFGEKTQVVPGLQRASLKPAIFNIMFKGMAIGKVQLPKNGNFNLGRRSSDSVAHIKVSPDMAMSRVHAAMRTAKTASGKTVYQITTIKPENPVYVNDVMIERGKICILKSGDKVRMGDTILTFIYD